MTSRAESALSASRRILTICSGLYLLPFMSCLSFAARLTLYPVHFLGVRSLPLSGNSYFWRTGPLRFWPWSLLNVSGQLPTLVPFFHSYGNVNVSAESVDSVNTHEIIDFIGFYRGWSGWRGSNPHSQLGRLELYH